MSALLALGLALPEALLPLARSVPQGVIVGGVLFVMAASVDVSQIGRALRSPRAVLLGVAVNALLVPLLAWPLAGMLRADLAIGLLVAAAVPSTLTSAAVWTRQAGGNDTVSVLVTLVTNSLCFLVMPAWLLLTTGEHVDVSPGAMMIDLAATVVAPMTLGQLARLWKPVALVADRRRAWLSTLAQLGILAIVGVGAVRSGDEIRRHAATERAVRGGDWALMLAAVAGLHTTALAAGHAAALAVGIPRAERIAVGFSGSQKTLMIGLRVSITTFGGLAMLPIVVYHVCQLLIDSLVVEGLSRRAARASATNDG